MANQDGVPALRGAKRVLTIKSRIVAIVAVAAASSAAVGLVGSWQIARVADQGVSIYDKGLVPDQEVSALREAVGRARADGISRANAKTPAAAVEYNKALESDEKAIDTLVAAHTRRTLSSTERDALNQFVTSWYDYREARVLGDQYARDGRNQEFEDLRAQRMTPDVNRALAALDSMSKASAATARSRLDAAQDARKTGLTISLIIIVLGLLVVGAAGLFTVRAIVVPLRRLRVVLASVAGGDLTSRVEAPAADEIGEMATALNGTLDTVHDIIRQLDATSRQLSGHAEEAASQSTIASAAIDLISGEIDAMNAEAEEVVTNLANIRVMDPEAQKRDPERLLDAVASISEMVDLLGRTISDNELAQATRTTASIVNNTRENADDLAQIAAHLSSMISIFKLGDGPATRDADRLVRR